VNNERHFHYRRHGPSLFFPILLITVGVIWMLINAGRISIENVYGLYPYWPVLLIALGLGILLDRISWLLSGLMWLALAGLTIWLLLARPVSLPATANIEWKHKTFTAPLNDAKSADVKLNLSVNSAQIYSLQDSTNLLDADIYYSGNLSFNDNNSGSNRRVSLDENILGLPFNFPAGLLSSQTYQWKIGLSPSVPLALEVSNGTGSTNMDLKTLQLKQLTVDGGTGSMNIALPEESPSYPFKLTVGTGSVTVNAPSGSIFSLDAKGGTGSLTIVLPQDAGVQIQVRDAGLGSLHIPDSFTKTSEGSGKGEGTWQNSAYSKTRTPISIVLDVGVGSVDVR
jgi:hypothetical protein